MIYKGFNTKAVQSGERDYNLLDTVVFPIFQTSTFRMNDEKYSDLNGRETFFYTRINNPTTRVAEKKIADICNGSDAVMFSSGMGAISAIFNTFLEEDDEVIMLKEMYGGTYKLMKSKFERLRIKPVLISVNDLENLEDYITRRTKMIYVETLTNPLIKLVDIQKVSEVARKNGIISVVDNTFMSPYNFRPLEFEIDVALHSTTKYIGGHSDLVGGVVVSRDLEIIQKLLEERSTIGSNPSPFDSFLTIRSLKTLGLRVKRQNQNAKILAEFLNDHPKVKKVNYPTLYKKIPDCFKSCPGFGGVMYIELESFEKAIEFMRNLKIIIEATSLAGVESLITSPVLTTHAGLSDEELEKAGISKGSLRISVGIEDIEDLIEDVKRALAKI
ncbi:MAG: cystathionine gamma-lyase [Thermotogaceae bacterium]|nr:cystathionine gamma-lyase [Thermotogaceae bacterium]